MKTAEEMGCRSLVMPPLGCGVAGFDLATGVRLILEEIARFEPHTLTDVRLIVYREADLEVVEEIALRFATTDRPGGLTGATTKNPALGPDG